MDPQQKGWLSSLGDKLLITLYQSSQWPFEFIFRIEAFYIFLKLESYFFQLQFHALSIFYIFEPDIAFFECQFLETSLTCRVAKTLFPSVSFSAVLYVGTGNQSYIHEIIIMPFSQVVDGFTTSKKKLKLLRSL